ncbi:hypothetical protein AUJ95_06110 [Candidatus Desantisbacteria bacterium CG2_30_40_21]|uniref:Glycoside hydrolase n=5 Tax=unclassified Candidatus Desantisiibacteriota TaxID=3106372 RepID=A0A2M7J8K0_9BACT|nr:MAG: hypothetical protein AUJ95_06110 [Candidatus Desantisbacteria bacterium CG2_30_40_21]PIP41917.1 MAG: glycoside hydrolase [Candidatus Desantisbacteria bacterium CG23_combo_of_CG06-09_8_20_14_all_40_23]PIX15704.1 MAG: glycoside hydrolase [Candidatus Desantisbacteria bacterium CG_4_8_14_3_um_filter_40_12]PIY19097.1 MAG: glycoside hydrolase [Candidatus Desantisbacteria bacterium CG_4_10_14_3_um_filter_40_18]PJB29330.1 MAG: glycoside hydrolase [Candidatus Desantisbacteria bacterium CG_4_9_14
MSNPLHVAFLWHMHQPFYKDISAKEYALPWVRLHGIKDYYDMVSVLDAYPKIHQTFNMVPSLMIQLDEYTQGASDKYLAHTLIPAKDLSHGQKSFILQEFFSANWDNMIKPFPRYRELIEKRGITVPGDGLSIAIKRFSTQDFLDLQVWFNIAWFDPQFQGKDFLLVNLIQKQRDFTEGEKQAVIDKQRELISWILPEYKRMQDTGQIEVSVTPYYHPILPLVCNMELARQSDPTVILPKKKFIAPEDARMQIKRAVECYQQHLGCNPRGMWPSEGSVCNDIIPMVADNGIKWLATDEWILYHTLGVDRYSAHLLYKPYCLEVDGRQVNMVFRDRTLSDTIGFTYSKWNTYDAVSDFITRLHHIKDMLPKKRNHLVCIAMDGENAWEYYSKNGWEFLEYLYTSLSHDEGIRCVTINEYLQENPPQETLTDIHPGSWINSNFQIWVGGKEENRAWDYLYEAREALVGFEKKHGPSDKTLEAWEYIYIAEGSDWFWWYGDKHYSPNADIFDSLFRGYLEGVYKILGLKVPEGIKKPIRISLS